MNEIGNSSDGAPRRRSVLDDSAERELARERHFGGIGVEADRQIRTIDLSEHERRRDEIDDELWSAAVDIGFFQVVGHGIPEADIEEAFSFAERFFALPDNVKSRRSMPPGTNSGWEFQTQKRPSTGTLDQKESYQITTSRMEALDLWPSEDDLAGFRTTMKAFERANWDTAMLILSSFARRLGFSDDFFAERHDPRGEHYQSTLRLLHYMAVTPDQAQSGRWRAGAHTDYDCLTLLHQREGQRGLEVCPGEDAETRIRERRPLAWTPIEPTPGAITCNIGDMLTRWSDDQLPSTLHRVRMPKPDEYLGPRYSLAFFAQANGDAIVQGPSKATKPITAADYLQQRINANFRP